MVQLNRPRFLVFLFRSGMLLERKEVHHDPDEEGC